MPLPILDLPQVRRLHTLGQAYHAVVQPEPLSEPRLLHLNTSLAEQIGLNSAAAQDPALLAVMSGQRPLGDTPALATVYAGHQFGSFVPQLGDGRALLIGEVAGPDGQVWELQLKGAGRTPFSRFGDGRAVLRSSIREYLCSEAMHALGIPTTRALCLVGSTEAVQRETRETAAVVCRVAPSHLRFGHFEFFYYRQRYEMLAPLADHLIEHHFPELARRPKHYAAWASEVVDRTARLIAQWQTVGFCHGVMNTDNMSALGLTMDYGPYGFLDAFHSNHICNHSDDAGRYAYDQQPQVAHWNCSRLLQATLPLLDQVPEQAVEIAEGILGRFPPAYTGAVMDRWRAKLGFLEAYPEDRELINRFLNLIDGGRGDFTLSFRGLGSVSSAADGAAPLRDRLLDPAGFDAWLPDYRARLQKEGDEDARRRARMDAVNPLYILRNHLAQQAIAAAEQGHLGELERLFSVLSKPFREQPGQDAYAAEPPAEMQHISVSCSS